MSAERLGWALAYAAQGFYVLPVWPPAEGDARVCSCPKGGECLRPAKHPIPSQGIKAAAVDPARIKAWWTEYPSANIAIATGSISGIIVVDVDTGDGKEGDIAITTACADQGGVPATLKARSGSGGAHYFYRFRENPFTRKIGFLKHVDYLSDGGYVIVQPSVNLKGGYAFDAEAGVGGPGDIGQLRAQMAELPEWFDKLEGTGRTGKKQSTKARNEATARARTVGLASMDFNPAKPFWVQAMRDALTHIDPDARENWMLIGIILGRIFFRSDDGWTLYEEWAGRSSKFAEKGTVLAMRGFYYQDSLDTPQSGQPASVGTIFRLAQEGGWEVPRNGDDDRPMLAYRPGRALETSEDVLRILTIEREAGNDGAARVYAFGSGLGEIIGTHDISALYDSAGRPPNGWVLKMMPYTPMALGSRITHSCSILRIHPNGSPTQVECPPEVSTMMLAKFAKHFPRLNGIVQWPMIVNHRIAGFDEPYDAKAGLAFNLPEGLDLSGVRGSLRSAKGAYKWFREVVLEGFPLDDRESARVLAMFLTFMQRRVCDIAPAFLITAPDVGNGKSALVSLAALTVHGRSPGASPFSSNSEEQRKAITAALMTNQPCIFFDNLKAGSVFNSEELAIAMTSPDWEDRKLGVSERVTLPNRAVWCFTGNNVSLKGDLKRRFVTIRLATNVTKHHTQKFSRVLSLWGQENRNAVLTALSDIALWGAQTEHNLKTNSGFSDWDREVRGTVVTLTGVDPYASDAEMDESEDDEAISAIVIAWALLIGAGKATVRDLIDRVQAAQKSSDTQRKHAAQAFDSAVATLRSVRLDRITPEDYGYAVKLLQDRPISMEGVSVQFVRVGMRNKVALWILDGAEELIAALATGF